jgi:transposase
MPGVAERRRHDYIRNGTTNLYAALDVASGKVIAEMTPRHRAEEFRRFLNLIDRTVPPHLDVHVVLDNSSTHKTPSIQRWLIRHPRFTLHFTPTYSSWLNLVERWFAELTTKWIKRGTHRSVRDLVASIRTWITNWNDNPKPIRLAQDRRPDPRQPGRLLPTNQRLRTLAEEDVVGVRPSWKQVAGGRCRCVARRWSSRSRVTAAPVQASGRRPDARAERFRQKPPKGCFTRTVTSRQQIGT